MKNKNFWYIVLVIATLGVAALLFWAFARRPKYINQLRYNHKFSYTGKDTVKNADDMAITEISRFNSYPDFEKYEIVVEIDFTTIITSQLITMC